MSTEKEVIQLFEKLSFKQRMDFFHELCELGLITDGTCEVCVLDTQEQIDEAAEGRLDDL